jgi:hypothetical protein
VRAGLTIQRQEGLDTASMIFGFGPLLLAERAWSISPASSVTGII